MAREIRLTQGQLAIVDDEDFDYLNQWKWFARWQESTQSFYAVRSVNTGDQIYTIFMHRLIMEAPEGTKVDHRYPAETLNNRRSNLRMATKQENNRNRRTGKNNTSGYKGVSWHSKLKTWRVRIKVESQISSSRSLGLYKDKTEAARVYDRAAIEHFGEFALLNFPREEYVNG